MFWQYTKWCFIIPVELHRFIAESYQLILAREPDNTALINTAVRLRSGESGIGFLRDLFWSQEFNNRGLAASDVVDIVYQLIYGRQPTGDESNYWSSEITDELNSQVDISRIDFMIFALAESSSTWSDLCHDYGINP